MAANFNSFYISPPFECVVCDHSAFRTINLLLPGKNSCYLGNYYTIYFFSWLEHAAVVGKTYRWVAFVPMVILVCFW